MEHAVEDKDLLLISENLENYAIYLLVNNHRQIQELFQTFSLNLCNARKQKT